jgi:hypothetical protein
MKAMMMVLTMATGEAADHGGQTIGQMIHTGTHIGIPVGVGDGIVPGVTTDGIDGTVGTGVVSM